MAGYTRNDTGNNIADGNIINASDLDGEYDAIQAAFDASTGHTHDGTTGEGAPIEVIGPTQDVVATASTLRPKTDNTVDLGTTTLEYKDLFIDGTAHIDTLDVDENATVAGTLDVTGAVGIDGNFDIATNKFTVAAASGNTLIAGTLGVTGTTTLATVNATTVDTTNLEVTNIKAKDGTAAGSIADSTGVVTLASSVLTTTDINGGTIDGTTIGGTTPAAITGTTITGTSFVSSGDMTFGDNDKAIFGAGSDLQIYHDGSNSIINDNGTGALQLQVGGSTKLATTATGVDVTGTITSDGLTVDGDGTIQTSDGALLSVRNTNAAVTAGTIIGEVRFESDDSSRTESIRNSIVSESIGTAANTDMHFRSADGDTLLNRMTISYLGDISFYEDTGTTAKFFWDASTERLGIGNAAPTTALDVTGTITSDGLTVDAAVGTQATGIALNGTSFADSERLSIDFQRGSIEGVRLSLEPSGGQTAGNFVVETGTFGATSDRLHIASNGDISFYEDTGTTPKFFWDASAESLGIGATSPGARVEATASGAVVQILNRTTSDGGILQFEKDGTTVGSIGTSSGDLTIGTNDVSLRFSDGANAIFAVNSSGVSRDAATNLGFSSIRFKDLYLSGGIYLGGTTSANLLDDYEEGTFTPVVADAASGGNEGSATDAYGYYTKTGRQVTVQITLLNIDTTGLTGANDLYITGLPFAAGSFSGVNYFTGSMSAALLTSSSDVVVPEILDPTSYVRLREWALNGSGTDWIIVSELTSGTADLNITLTYFTA